MIKVAAVLLIGGIGILIGYWLYFLLSVIYTEQDVPVLIKVAVPMVISGLTLLISTIAWHRIQSSKEENFEEVDY